MDNLTLQEYVARRYNDVMEEYNRYLDRHNLPEVGEMLIAVRSGFGGYAGVYRRVIEVTEKEIYVSDGERTYLSYVDAWWMDFKRKAIEND